MIEVKENKFRSGFENRNHNKKLKSNFYKNSISGKKILLFSSKSRFSFDEKNKTLSLHRIGSHLRYCTEINYSSDGNKFSREFKTKSAFAAPPRHTSTAKSFESGPTPSDTAVLMDYRLA